MKHIILFLTAALVFGQTDLVREREIKSTGQYRWGEGVHADPTKAEDAAMRDLVQKIYVAVTTRTERDVTETDTEFHDTTRVQIGSYSALQLLGVDELRFQKDGSTRVVAFIDTADLTRSFELSKRKVRDMVALGQQAESECRIGDALRSYYWAYLLTHTYFGELSLDLGLGISSSAQTALAEKINRLATEISTQAEPCYREAGSVNALVYFYHSGEPVRNLNVKYYSGDGIDWETVEDGRAWLSLNYEPERRHHPLSLSIEYAYPTEMYRRNPEIENLFRIFQDKGFDCTLELELLVPWLPEEPPSPASSQTLPALKSSTKSGNRWSVTIQVLSGIEDSREFRRALADYADVGYLKFTRDVGQIGEGFRIFSVLLDEQRVQALFYHDKDRLIDTSSGKVYDQLTDAFKGEAYQIWIGVPVK